MISRSIRFFRVIESLCFFLFITKPCLNYLYKILLFSIVPSLYSGVSTVVCVTYRFTINELYFIFNVMTRIKGVFLKSI